eukprot:COSAG01_NODE_7814_length_3046_cov_1.184255_3_plen_80_part_00
MMGAMYVMCHAAWSWGRCSTPFEWLDAFETKETRSRCSRRHPPPPSPAAGAEEGSMPLSLEATQGGLAMPGFALALHLH